YGSDRLWSDAASGRSSQTSQDWVHYHGDLAHDRVTAALPEFGALVYLTTRVDSFCPSITEALAAGVIVITSAHGANAEYIQHGRNGFLVPCNTENAPSLETAREIVCAYLEEPDRFAYVRSAAKQSVGTWMEQARQWENVWTRE